jgi:hypothetical protein
MKFTFASLNEYAEGKKNFKKYVCEYYANLVEQTPDGKVTYFYIVIAEKFGVCAKQVERIIKEAQNTPI